MLDTHSAIAAAHALPDPTARCGVLTGLMAAFMIERTSSDGNCTEADLLGAGFTSTEIIELGQEATKTAARQAMRQVEPADAVNGPQAIHSAFRDLIGCAEEAGLANQPGYARAVRRGRLALDGLAAVFEIRAASFEVRA